MAKYMVVHKVKTFPETQVEWIDLLKSIRENACEGTLWLQSFFDSSSSWLYCHWEAESEEAILSCLPDDVIEMAPVDHVSEIVLIDSAWLDDTT